MDYHQNARLTVHRASSRPRCAGRMPAPTTTQTCAVSSFTLGCTSTTGKGRTPHSAWHLPSPAPDSIGTTC